MPPHPWRTGRYNKTFSVSIHDNTVDNYSLCFYATSGSDKQCVLTIVVEYMKNKECILEYSRNICNVCLSKVTAELWNIYRRTLQYTTWHQLGRISKMRKTGLFSKTENRLFFFSPTLPRNWWRQDGIVKRVFFWCKWLKASWSTKLSAKRTSFFCETYIGTIMHFHCNE